MMNNPRDNLRKIYLEKARTAHLAVRRCDIERGRTLYNQLERVDFISLFFDPVQSTWPLSSSQSQATLDELCFYLAEHSLLKRSWQDWNEIADLVLKHPDFATIDENRRLKIDAMRVYSQFLHGKQNHHLPDLIAHLLENLESLSLSSLNRAFHHMAIGVAYKLLRDEEESLYHHHCAATFIDIDEEPFYAILGREFIGDTVYFLNQNRKHRYQYAIEIYEETGFLARHYANGFDFTVQAYNLGWVYAELGMFEQALDQFNQGLQEAMTHGSQYEQVLNYYGIGYVNLMQEDYSDARDHLIRALESFMDSSHVMSAACLNLLARVDALFDLDAAVNWAHNALDNLERTHHPVQQNHVYKTLAGLYWKQGMYRQAMTYFMKTYWQRLKIGLPLFSR